MTEATKDQLFEAWQFCDDEDKSTEFMFQYMADTAGVSHETAVDFVAKTTEQERNDWYMRQLKLSIEADINVDVEKFYEDIGKEALDSMDARGAIKTFARWLAADTLKYAVESLEETSEEEANAN